MYGKIMSQVLESRHISEEELRNFEQGSVNPMKNTDDMCAGLRAVHDKKEQIVILPDFDMDGISSGTLGLAGMSELGFNVALYIPNANGAYGFDESDIDNIMEQYPDSAAIITCDVGSACYSGIEYAKKLGFKVFVTDHHIIPLVPRDADTVVNPLQQDDPYEHKGVCGAYVLWYVLRRYAELYENVEIVEAIDRLRVFAGIGTIADAMPVLYENRQIVRDAVAICRSVYCEGSFKYVRDMGTNEVYTRAFLGLFYVLKAYQELGKIGCPDDINEEFFGYYMGPMFNALKRMGEPVEKAFSVFFGGDQEERVAELIAINEQRKLLVEELMDGIYSSDNPLAPYVYILDTVRSGFTGLLAAKLMKESGVPTIVVRKTDKGYEGSGRSPQWFPMVSFVQSVPEMRCTAAGHDAAFGFTAEDETALKNFVALLADNVGKYEPTEVIPEYDAIVGSELNFTFNIDDLFQYIRDKNALRPFGPQFEKPKILFLVDSAYAVFSYIGSDQRHLRIMLPGGVKILCWGQAGKEKEIGDTIEIAGDVNENTYMGTVSVQIEGDLIV